MFLYNLLHFQLCNGWVCVKTTNSLARFNSQRFTCHCQPNHVLLLSYPLIQPKFWLGVGLCIQNFPCSASFCCVLGVNVEVWTKSILNRFIRDQTPFSTSWHVKMSWPSMHWDKKFFVQTSTPTPSMNWKLTKRAKYCIRNNQLLTITLVESKDNSIIVTIWCGWKTTFIKKALKMIGGEERVVE